MKKLLVWDLPVRLFHWSIVVLVVASIVTGEIGDELIEYHAYIGYMVLSLLIFRVGWGFFGGSYSRFSIYLELPKRLYKLLSRRAADANLGFSTLGLIAVFFMLALLWAQALTGLFASDDLMFDGPLRHLVGGAISDKLTAIHKIVGPTLIGFIVLHLCAIAFYKFVLKDNRALPMLRGYREVPAETPDELAGTAGRPLVALGLLLVSAGAVWYIVTRL